MRPAIFFKMQKNQNDQGSHDPLWWRMPLLAIAAAAAILCIDGERLAALVTGIAGLILYAVALFG